jgi:hypothetical protein
MKKRVAALESRRPALTGGIFVTGSLMSPAEWDKVVPLAQAELVRETQQIVKSLPHASGPKTPH